MIIAKIYPDKNINPEGHRRQVNILTR